MVTLDKIQALSIFEEAAIRKAQNRMSAFVLYTKPDYDMQWFHEVICNKIDEFEKGLITHLMMLAPPQHGKSEICTRRSGAYFLGKDPKRKIGVCAYNATIAERFNRDIQRIIDSKEYHDIFPDTYLNESNVVSTSKGNYLRNSEIFETVNHKGYLVSVGRGGPLTSLSLDIGIIDDPIKDRKEAMSLTIRDSAWDWLVDVFETRFHNKSQFLFMVTRWHEDDPAGRLLKRDGEKKDGGLWEVIKFPALKTNEYCEYDPREEGEALWENRHSRERIERIKYSNIRTFNSLYQQDPKPDTDAALWKPSHFKKVDLLPEFKTVIVSVDPSATGNKDSDECGIICMGKDAKGDVYVFKDETGIYTPLKWANKVVYLHNNIMADKVVAEVNQGWDMVKTIINQIDPKIKVIDVNAKRGKTLRALPVVSLYEQGRIFHTKGLNKLEYEMTTWTDDEPYSPGRIDALVHGITHLFEEKKPIIDYY